MDSIALPVLLASYRVLGEASWRGRPARAARPPRADGRRPRPAWPRATIRLRAARPRGAAVAPQELASLVIGNTTGTEQLIRVRRIRESVRADCGVVLDDPTGALSRDLFANAETWLIAPGRALPLRQRRGATPT